MIRAFKSTLALVRHASVVGCTTLDSPGKVAARIEPPVAHLPPSMRGERTIDVGKGALALTQHESSLLFGDRETLPSRPRRKALKP